MGRGSGIVGPQGGVRTALLGWGGPVCDRRGAMDALFRRKTVFCQAVMLATHGSAGACRAPAAHRQQLGGYPLSLGFGKPGALRED